MVDVGSVSCYTNLFLRWILSSETTGAISDILLSISSIAILLDESAIE